MATRNYQGITVQEARGLLGRSGDTLGDSELTTIVRDMDALAEVAVGMYKVHKSHLVVGSEKDSGVSLYSKGSHTDEGSYIHQGFNGRTGKERDKP